MDKVESRLSSLKVINSRKPLGPRPTYVYKNLLSKISTEGRKNSVKDHTFKHINDLLNVNHCGLSPSNLLCVFRTLLKNAHFNKTHILGIYKAIFEKILYFSPSQTIHLLECMNNLSTFSFLKIGKKDYMESQENQFTHTLLSRDDCKENDVYEPTGTKGTAEIETLQSKIISTIIDRYTSKSQTGMSAVKNKKHLMIRVKCLQIALKPNSLGNISWEGVSLLSNSILSTLSMLIEEDSGYYDTFFSELINYTNILADLLSLKTIEEIIGTLTFISSDVVFKETLDPEVSLTNEIVTYINNGLGQLYSNGEVQILNFLVNHSFKIVGKSRSVDLYYSHKNLSVISDMTLLYNKLADLVCNVLSSLPHEKLVQLSDAILNLNFKIVNIGRYLLNICGNCNNINEKAKDRIIELSSHFISYLYNHETKKFYDSISVIISLPALSSTSTYKNTHENTSNYGFVWMYADVLRRSYSLVQADINKLSNLDILNIFEKLTQSFNYTHQSIFRILLYYSFSRSPSTQLDVLILLKLYQISSDIPHKLLHNKQMLCNILKSDRLYFEIHDSEHYKRVINRICNRISTVPRPGNCVCQFDSTVK